MSHGALALVLVLATTSASATVRLELQGSATVTALQIRATNAGDGAATDVTPQVAYQHRDLHGDAAAIPAGATHEWTVPLPQPPGPGTFAAMVHVRYTDAGVAATAPLVVLVPVPTAPASSVATSIELAPGPGLFTARVALDNQGSRPLAGRIVFVLPSVLLTTPESHPVQVRPGERRVLPAAIESRGARDDATYPVWAVLEYDDDGIHYAVVARAEASGRPAAASSVPLAVGALALGLAVGVIAFASRAARRRAARGGQLRA